MKPGMGLRGEYVDGHDNTISFDPNYIHATEPFTGARYARTHYILAKWKDLARTPQHVLIDYGVHLPVNTYRRKCAVHGLALSDSSGSEEDSPPLVPSSDS